MQYLRSVTLLLLIIGLAMSATGCRNRPGDGGDNGNDNGDNGNDNGNGGGELTAAEREAIDDVFAGLESTAMALAGIIQGFGGDAEPQGLVQVGECPEVTFETVDGSVVTMLDFGDGCTNDYFEEISASGAITLTFGIVTRSLNVDYDSFTVDAQTTTGSLDLEVTREDSQRTLSGSIDISTTGVGSVSGSLEIELDLAAGTITVVEATWTVTSEDDDTYAVEVAGIVIAPIDNGNFVPQAGTITVIEPNDDRSIMVEFDENSPVDGTVDVTIEERTVEYELPAVQ